MNIWGNDFDTHRLLHVFWILIINIGPNQHRFTEVMLSTSGRLVVGRRVKRFPVRSMQHIDPWQQQTSKFTVYWQKRGDNEAQKCISDFLGKPAPVKKKNTSTATTTTESSWSEETVRPPLPAVAPTGPAPGPATQPRVIGQKLMQTQAQYAWAKHRQAACRYHKRQRV